MKAKHESSWVSGRSQLVVIARNAWQLVWAQRKVVGRQLPWGSAAVLAAAALIILDQSDQPRQHFQLVCELLLPVVGAVSVAYLFSPENDPPMELLYTCPCSVSALLGARLIWLAVIVVLPLSVVQVVFLSGQSSLQPRDLWLFVQIWVPPTICLSGLGLFAAQLVRSAQAGVLAGAMIWVLQVLILPGSLLKTRRFGLFIYSPFSPACP